MTASIAIWLLRFASLTLAASLLVLYLRGSEAPGRPVGRRDRVFFYLSLFLLLALLWTPAHRLATQLFGLHVLQHLLLSALIPALFWFANPLPRLEAGLPAGVRTRIRSTFRPEGRPFRWLTAGTNRGIVWLAFVACAWLWYDPLVHSAVRRFPFLHAFEVGTMLLTATLYWWHIARAYPVLHLPLPRWVHMLYTYAGSGPIKLIGAAFIFSSQPFYDYSAAELAAWGLSPAANQMIGGILIWTFGGVAYTIAAGTFMRRLMQQEAEKPVLPIEAWSNDMLMPGA